MANEQAESLTEADEQLKKRARRRLVGAAALVLVAVIVLPLVMDHEPRPAAPEIQVHIPSPQDVAPLQAKGTSPKAKPAELAADGRGDHGAAGGKLSAKPEPKPEAGAESKPEPKPEQAASTVPATKTESPQKQASAAGSVPTDKGAEKGADKAVAKPADKVADKPAADKAAADTKRAEAALAGSGGAASGGQWVVQLGAYKEAGNVKLLLGKIKEMGLPAYTEKFDSPQGQRTRVRAGPFPTKEAAERAAQRIKTIGVSGPVAPK